MNEGKNDPFLLKKQNLIKDPAFTLNSILATSHPPLLYTSSHTLGAFEWYTLWKTNTAPQTLELDT